MSPRYVLSLLFLGFCWSYSSASNNSSAALHPSSSATLTIEVNSSVFQQISLQSASQTTASGQKTSANNGQSSISPTAANSQSTQTSANVGMGQVPTQTIPSSSSSTRTECDKIEWSEKNNCNDKKSCEAYLESLEHKMKCLKNKPANISTMELTESLEKAGMEIAEDLVGKPNATYSLVKDPFVMVCGVAEVDFINTTKDEFLPIPSYADPSFLTGSWETMRDSLSIPIMELRKRGLPAWKYVFSVQNNLVEDRPLKLTEIETDYNQIIKDSDVSDLYLDENNELKSRKKLRRQFINSNVITFTFQVDIKKLDKPVRITFRHKKIGLEDPKCVFMDKEKSIWSGEGLEVEGSNDTHTTCLSSHLSMFGLAMKENHSEDLSERETLVVVAIVVGTISMVLLIAAAACIFYVGYYHSVDNMKIALNIDLSLIFCHLFFFIGLSNEASKFLASPATCEVVAPFVHTFELAALSFLLMEALHYRSLFKPVFSKKNTRTFYIYASLGWGIPVAFGSAVAGYTYKHHGSPFRNEFCWISVYDVDVWYFGSPVLILAVLNLIVRAVVLKDVLGWKGDPDDINIERTKTRLITSLVLLPVIIITWILGVGATNNSEDRTYHYFFVIFHALQGILFFVFYCAKNTEMWDYYKTKKEKQTEEKNAVYHFQYVP